MNGRIREQLQKCKVANIPPYTDADLHISIPKANTNTTTKPKESEFEVGKQIVIYVENYIINEPEGFTLSSNWNQGTKPSENKLRVIVTNDMGKMVRVSGCGFNNTIPWTGWLPKKAVTIIDSE